MSPKLQKVCNFYLQGMSMRQALLSAGYTDGYASHMSSKFLHNRECQRYIRERQKAEADAALADAIYIKKKLMDIVSDSTATVKERSDALKILDQHNEWNEELKAKYKLLEAADKVAEKAPIQITINELKKDG